MITCAQKVGVLPHIIHYTKSKITIYRPGDKFREENMLKSSRKEDPAPYPARPPLKFLVNHEKSVLLQANAEKRVSRWW